MNLRPVIDELRTRVSDLIESGRGRNIATFSVFLLISAFFWLLMKMNEEQQKDFNMQVEIVNLPPDVTLLTSSLPVVNVSVRDKGTSLLKFGWGELPPLSFRFNELPAVNNRLVIGTLQTNNAVRQLFGQATIGSVKPDSILVPFTRRPGKFVNVRMVEGDIQVNERCIRSGRLELLTDSVLLYSATNIPRTLRTLSTQPVTVSDITDTTVVSVRLDVPAGMRAIPEEVKIRIPVEPLIAASRTVRVQIEGAPAGLSVVPFPTTVKVNYLVSKSRYNNETEIIHLFADYRRRNTHTSRMPLSVSMPKDAVCNITLETDSVEYLVEHHD